MIAESVALDGGVLTISAVAGLLVVVAGGAAWAATTRSAIASIAKDVAVLVRGQREHARTLDDHRSESEAKTTELGARVTRLEIVAELTPIHGVPTIDPRPTTGRHDRLRGDTPRTRPREDTGDTGSGMHER